MNIGKILINSALKDKEGICDFIIMTSHDGIIQTPEEYLKWINYIPPHWNIEELKNKKIFELTEKELEILQIIKEEEQVKVAFINVVSDEPTKAESVKIVYEYMKKMTIPKYAKLKLTPEELSECKSQVTKTIDPKCSKQIIEQYAQNIRGGEMLHTINEKIEKRLEELKNSDNILEAYESYILRVKKNNLNEPDLQLEIKSMTGKTYSKSPVF